jgi:surface protein
MTTISAAAHRFIEDDSLVYYMLSYLDLASLLQKQRVCKRWRRMSTVAIDKLCCPFFGPKVFESQEELKAAVSLYCDKRKHNHTALHYLAMMYGYPINKWDVSQVSDFSDIFCDQYFFNEPIGAWDVSNATTMHGMFRRACSFNQDISSWDVSQVTDMSFMFYHAKSFTQDLREWNVENVVDTAEKDGIDAMFLGADELHIVMIPIAWQGPTKKAIC